MQRVTVTFFAFWLFLAFTLQAQAGLNPFDWFGGGNKELLSLNVASPAEEAEAAALLERGKDKLAAGSTASAKRSFKKIIKKYPTATATADARFLRARILMDQGHWLKGFDQLQEIITKHPKYENFDRVISAQFDCATALMEGARGRILWIIPGFKQYSEAIKQFEQIVRNAPYSNYAPLALMNIAIISEQRGNAEAAIDSLDRLINYYPQSMLAPEAYYNMAKTYANLVKGPEYDQGSTRQAISYYEDFLILFPQSKYLGEVESNLKAMEDLLARSRLNLGDFYYNYRSNNTAALIFYNETITLAPDSEAAGEARERIADIELGVTPVTSGNLLRKFLRAE